MRKILANIIFLVLFIVPSTLAFAEGGSNVYIPKGTQIAVELTDSVTSKSTFIGETLMVTVLEDFVINNVVVIEQGSKGFVSVADMKRSGEWGKSGGVVIKPQYLKTANWIKVPLSGQIQTSGEGHPSIEPLFAGGSAKSWGKDVGSSLSAFASIILFPSPSPGGDATIPAGTKLIVTVSENIDLGVAPSGLAPVMTAEAVKRSSSEFVNNQNWTGDWISSRGKITLQQARGSLTVTGKYERSNGQLIGTIIGDKLVGKWTEDQTDKAPSGKGEFEFILSSNGTSVLMLWKNDYSGNWTQDRLGARLTGL